MSPWTTHSVDSSLVTPVEEGWSTLSCWEIRPLTKFCGHTKAWGGGSGRQTSSQPVDYPPPHHVTTHSLSSHPPPPISVPVNCLEYQEGLWSESSRVWCKVILHSNCSRKNRGRSRGQPPRCAQETAFHEGLHCRNVESGEYLSSLKPREADLCPVKGLLSGPLGYANARPVNSQLPQIPV